MSDLRQIEAAYKAMAVERYRPAAPSDGLGTITKPLEELDLDAEARDYALLWCEAEDEGAHWVGCCDWVTRPAVIFATEAVRVMNGGVMHGDERQLAARLLRMSAEALKAVS